MAEILAQRVGDGVLVADQEADGAVEPFDALFGARGAVLEMRLALLVEHAAHLRARIGDRSCSATLILWPFRG